MELFRRIWSLSIREQLNIGNPGLAVSVRCPDVRDGGANAARNHGVSAVSVGLSG
jgi:hypothetical protein